MKTLIKSELTRVLPEILFIINEHDGVWQCAWTDGPTKNQMEFYFKTIFPAPESKFIEIVEGIELHIKPTCLAIELVRFISPLRESQILSHVEDENISHVILEQYEEKYIKDGLIPSFEYNKEVGVFLSNKGNPDIPTLTSSVELTKRLNDLTFNSTEKLMMSTLISVIGVNRVNELLEEGKETVQEMFEAVAYSLFSDINLVTEV